jgi:uncharacterized membrane protein
VINPENLFENAFLEYKDMLNGAEPISTKHMVFLRENAYSDGRFSYSDFDAQIQGIVLLLNKMITQKGIG